ncbi:MAG: N-acetylmuramoyl-L-alanine amidase [Bacteroidetes bacterium]|nr:N-acetylmuramoyl-L-alanine amidase [Bacteroidota bacterium]MBL6944665.1 N-acetylmuramoyl-L-alanine amidase [Bacteroidales bacterium]
MAFFFANQPVYSQKGSKIKTIVIDAGHGGKDPGALGRNSREKDIVLSVALKTGEYIKKNFPYVNVIYTRKSDVFVPLHKRGEIANQINADLFISIHCNANPSTKIYGAETYVLGVEDNRTKMNMEVAMKENAAILLEEDAASKYDDFDPNSPESLISLMLFQNDNLDQSLNIAQKIQQQFTDRVGRKDRSVYQAGFLVLWKTSMPSVLVELGYLSNPAEEKFLGSTEGQVYMASAIYRAFKEYKREFEKENNAWEYRKQIVKAYDGDSAEAKVKTTAENPTPIYKVQIYTSPLLIPTTHLRFKKLENLSYYKHNGIYKYTSGSFETLEQAYIYRKKVRSKGFPDAFVVAFLNNNRITITEASLLKKPD